MTIPHLLLWISEVNHIDVGLSMVKQALQRPFNPLKKKREINATKSCRFYIVISISWSWPFLPQSYLFGEVQLSKICEKLPFPIKRLQCVGKERIMGFGEIWGSPDLFAI